MKFLPNLKKSNKPFRAFVPFLLNKRVYIYMLDPGDPAVTIDISMKKYTKPGVWVAQKVRTVFSRRIGFFVCEGKTVQEVFYTIDNDKVKFENEDCLTPLPVLM